MASTNTDVIASILSALKLNQIIAMVSMAVVTILDIAFIAVKLFSGASTSSPYVVYGIIVGVVMTALTIMVYYWSTVVASGAYVSGSASLMQVSMTGGQGGYPPASAVTPSGVTGTALTANDLSAVQSLITAGKISPTILSILPSLSASEIQTLLKSLGV